jgi:hypothetical protein
LIALVAAIALAQAGPTPKAPVGPTLPPGCNEAFLSLAIRVQERLEAGDFAGAKSLYAMLPKTSITLAWDAASIPAAMRPSFESARDRAVKTWENWFPGWKVTVVPYTKGMKPPPQIVVTFVPSIPAQAGEALPRGAASFFSEDPLEPRLEHVVSLSRGNPVAQTEFAEVHNEVGYALAQYYGVERTPGLGTYSSRTELSVTRLNTVASSDKLQVQAILDSCSLLAKHLMKQERIVVARPKLHFDPTSFDLGMANQGERIPFKMQVTNVGNAPLVVRAIPDCSCVSAIRPNPIEPGESRLLTSLVDLQEVTGEFDKNLILYSNDPERTSTFLPVRVKSRPAYRFFPANEGNVLMEAGGAKTKVVFALPEGSTLKALATRFDGIEAKVGLKPWTGRLDDPEMKDIAYQKGYEVEVSLSDQIAPGRSTGTLWIQTDNPKFREVYVNLFVQKGIVALPDQIRLGEIAASPRRAGFLLSRPGREFKITRVSADVPYLEVSHQPVRENWEHRINVQFNGKAPPGILTAVVTVQTDDPTQPVIRVPYHAIVQ